MGLRDSLAKNPVVVIGVAVVAVGLAVWVFTSTGRPSLQVEKDFYYDLETKTVFEDAVGKVPPFTTRGGKQAVRAVLFSCSDCSDAASRFVGYLEQYSDAYRQAMGNPDAFTAEVAEQGQLIRPESGEQWVSIVSDEGRKLRAELANRCEGQAPQACRP